MSSFVILAVLVWGAQAQNPCAGLPDGSIPEWGCESYTICFGGLPSVVDCEAGLVFNEETGQCENKNDVPPPCGYPDRDCSGKADASYPEFDDGCESFYTCVGGIYFGHNPCNPGTVFDFLEQTCDWPANVAPPCGTFVPATTAAAEEEE